jgi:hypothetical protein
MKIFIALFVFSLSAYATELKFIGACDEDFVMRTEVNESFQNVGVLTIQTLKKFGIPFLGNEHGLNTVFNSPIGLDALEIISDTEMRSYGWCFEVNGIIPELFPSEIPLTSEIQSITWFYGYAHYLDGVWKSQCEPAWKIKPAFLCQ